MVRFDIDLTFGEVGADDPAGLHGTVKAAGSEITVFLSDPSRLPGGRGLLPQLRIVAAALARRGMSVTLEGPAGRMVSFGAVHTNALQRLVSRSPHIALGTPAAVAPLRAGSRAGSALRVPAPPTTLFPVAPTVGRGGRGRITTTHYIPGSGRPRLIFVIGSAEWDGRPPREFDLLPGRTTIGSAEGCDLRLEGLEPLHAEVVHDGNDEYVLRALAPTGGGTARIGSDGAVESEVSNASSPEGRVLRTGARIDLGQWRLAYFREEFADHGRPHGGRVGGELSRQRSQPARPTAASPAPPPVSAGAPVEPEGEPQ